MRRMRKRFFRNKISLLILIVVVGLLLLLIFGSHHSDKSSLNKTKSGDIQVNDNSTLKLSNDKNEVESVVKKTLSEEGLCEDYSLKEGEDISLDSHIIKVKRISKDAVLLLVDGENFYLSEGEDRRINDFLIEIKPHKIFYFQANDPINAVTLRLGCKTTGEDPKDKYVREEGLKICKQIYDECRSNFNIN